MFIRARIRAAAWMMTVGAVVWAAQAACGQDIPFSVGDRVVTTSKVEVQAAQGAVATLDAGAELVVAGVKQGWIGVAGEQNGKKFVGWVRPKSLAAVPKGSTVEAFEQGYAAHMRADYDTAIGHYTEAIQIDPQNAKAFNNRGLAYQAKHDPKRAIADFTEALRLSPKLTSAYVNRGTVYAGLSELDKALADFSEAIKADPKHVQAYRLRAAVYETKGYKTKANADLREAAKAYRPKYDTIAQKVMKIESEVKGKDFLLNYETLDSIIDEAKARIRAQSAYTKDDALRTLATIDDILVRKRFINVDQGLLCDAIGPRKMTPKMAKGIDPKAVRFHVQAGEPVYFSNSYANSLIYAAIGEALGLPIAIVSAPGSAFVRWCYEGASCVNWDTIDGQPREDEEILSSRHISKSSVRNGVYMAPLSQNEILSTVYANLGFVWSGVWFGLENEFRDKDAMKRLPKAIACLTKAVELNPKACEAYVRRAMFWSSLGEHEKAIADANLALQLDTEYVAAYYSRGLAWAARNDDRKAIDNFNKAIELDPKQAPSYFSRSVARARAREFDKAMADINKAIELDPRSPNSYMLRANLWEAKNKPDQARADMEKARDLSQRR